MQRRNFDTKAKIVFSKKSVKNNLFFYTLYEGISSKREIYLERKIMPEYS